MALISVIIPCYNHAPYLRQRIDSVLNQTCRDFELLILDDCSTDNSRDIIEEYLVNYPHIRYFNNKTNSGNPFKQWDYGVHQAIGKYIWIAESDDYASSDFLERSLTILSENENIGFVFCNSKIIDEQNNRSYLVSDLRLSMHPTKWEKDYQNVGLKEISDFLFLDNTINNVSGVLIRKNKYIDAGYADHSMKYCGDWFLYLRLLLISDVAYIATPLNVLRLHARSSFNYYFSSDRYFREVLTIYRFIMSKIRLRPVQKITMGRRLAGIIYRRFITWLTLK